MARTIKEEIMSKIDLLPNDIKNNTEMMSYRLLDKNDNLELYAERNAVTLEWEDKTAEYLEWKNNAEKFITQQKHRSHSKSDEVRQSRPAKISPDDELYEAQELLAKLLKKEMEQHE